MASKSLRFGDQEKRDVPQRIRGEYGKQGMSLTALFDDITARLIRRGSPIVFGQRGKRHARGMNWTTFCDYVTPGNPPTHPQRKTYAAIAEVLRINEAWLLRGEGPKDRGQPPTGEMLGLGELDPPPIPDGVDRDTLFRGVPEPVRGLFVHVVEEVLGRAGRVTPDRALRVGWAISSFVSAAYNLGAGLTSPDEHLTGKTYSEDKKVRVWIATLNLIVAAIPQDDEADGSGVVVVD